MPYDSTPSKSTYTTKDISLLMQWESRDRPNLHDSLVTNCFYELIQNRSTSEKDYYVTSREGTVEYAYSLPSSILRGLWYWEDQDKLYVAYNNVIDVVQASTGTLLTTIAPGFAMATTEVGFEQFSYDTGVVKLVVTDGTILGTIDSANAFAASGSVDLPVPHLPCPVYVDGYIFVIKAGTADIYNSNLNDPLLYTAGDFITAEMLPDNLLRLVRLNNYLVAFGSNSIEYFWDAGVETGSPLQRNDTPIKLVGYQGGIAHWGNKLFFVGNTENTTPEVFMLQDFKIESLGTPPIRRYIQPGGVSVGSVVSFAGHDFYVLYYGEYTYMVDLETKLWTRLAYKQQQNFPITFALNIPISGYGSTSLMFLQGIVKPVYFRQDVYLDSGVDFQPTIITDNEDFGTYRKKFGGRISIAGDRTAGNITLYWTDDDYQTWTVGRPITLNQIFPHTDALGSFRRRAHKLIHTGNAKMRLQSMEMDFNMGGR